MSYFMSWFSPLRTLFVTFRMPIRRFCSEETDCLTKLAQRQIIGAKDEDALLRDSRNFLVQKRPRLVNLTRDDTCELWEELNEQALQHARGGKK